MRGVLHSLHALARAEKGLNDVESCERDLDEALHLAIDLGEPLEQAKIAHTRAELAMARGEPAAAVEHALEAMNGFIRCGTSYDVAHARLSLAEMYAAAGDERQGLLYGAMARAVVERKNLAILRMLYPAQTFPYADRITAGLLAYACGDALGLPWENRPGSVDLARALTLPAPRAGRGDRPRMTPR